MSSNNEQVSQGQERFVSGRLLRPREIALLELYQRQDGMSAQLWQHFLLVNVAVVAVVALVTLTLEKLTPLWGFQVPLLLSAPVLGVWLIFTFGGLGALRNSQRLLQRIAHQIEGDIGDKLNLFVNVTRSPESITWFHLGVDICVLGLCVLLVARSIVA